MQEQKNNKKKKKFNFGEKKKNTIKSLTEVESFLRDFKKMSKYIMVFQFVENLLHFLQL